MGKWTKADIDSAAREVQQRLSKYKIQAREEANNKWEPSFKYKELKSLQHFVDNRLHQLDIADPLNRINTTFDNLLLNIKASELPNFNELDKGGYSDELRLFILDRPDMTALRVIDEFVNYRINKWTSSIEKD